jgi:hypothetical protein
MAAGALGVEMIFFTKEKFEGGKFYQSKQRKPRIQLMMNGSFSLAFHGRVVLLKQTAYSSSVFAFTSTLPR